MNPLVPLVDVRLGEELFAEAGVAPEKEDERDAHDEEDADDDQRDQERRVSLLVGSTYFCFSPPTIVEDFGITCLYLELGITLRDILQTDGILPSNL